MNTILTVFFAVMGVAAAAALVVLLVQDHRDRPDPNGGPFCFDFDDHADEAIALLGDDFAEWERELSNR